VENGVLKKRANPMLLRRLRAPYSLSRSFSSSIFTLQTESIHHPPPNPTFSSFSDSIQTPTEPTLNINSSHPGPYISPTANPKSPYIPNVKRYYERPLYRHQVQEVLKAPFVVLQNVPISAIPRDVERFVKTKGPFEVQDLITFRNESLQPNGTWMVVFKTSEDARVFLKNAMLGSRMIGASHITILPKSVIDEEYFKNHFFFLLGHYFGKAVLIRNLMGPMSADFVKVYLKDYRLAPLPRKIYVLPENRSHLRIPSPLFVLVKLESESEAYRLVREKHLTKVFPKMHMAQSFEVIY